MMDTARNITDGFFSAPTEDGIRLSGMFVLSGDALRLRWTIDGWGWVVAKTTGEFVAKRSIIFFGQTEIEFRLVLGQEIHLQVINPFGRVSKRFIAVPNVKGNPYLPKTIKENIAASRIRIDASVCTQLMQAKTAKLEALCQKQVVHFCNTPNFIKCRPPDVQNIQAKLDVDALKASTKDMSKFCLTNPWAQEWKKLLALARTANSNEGVTNVNH